MSEPLPEVSGDVLDRIEAAGAADGLIQDPLGGDTPSAPINDSTPDTPAAPVGSETQGGTTPAAAEDSFTKLDPNALPEELRPYYSSLQGDYTRKMQDAAPWRKLGEELGVDDPTAIKQAVELYAYLQDEGNVRDFVAQLAPRLGIEPAPPAIAPRDDVDVDDLDVDSPALQELRNELAEVRSQLDKRDQAAEAERVYYSLAGEVARQEAMLAEQHPEWTEDDWNAVYDLAPAFDGDLTQTANALESFASSRLAAFVNGKTTVAEQPGLQPAPPARTADTPVDVSKLAEEDHELRGAADEARAFIRNVLANSE